MNNWQIYAIAAAVLYGLHQVFTKLAAERIGEGVGSFVVEASAAVTILLYLVYLWIHGKGNQPVTSTGFMYSILTGICVGIGTLAFFLMFQKGGPLSAVPMILAGGAALMAVIGIVFFGESHHWSRLLGITFAVLGLILLKKA